jgi:hypothetical protein
VFALGAGEVAADDALELGEFADHGVTRSALHRRAARSARAARSSPSPQGRGGVRAVGWGFSDAAR